MRKEKTMRMKINWAFSAKHLHMAPIFLTSESRIRSHSMFYAVDFASRLIIVEDIDHTPWDCVYA